MLGEENFKTAQENNNIHGVVLHSSVVEAAVVATIMLMIIMVKVINNRNSETICKGKHQYNV